MRKLSFIHYLVFPLTKHEELYIFHYSYLIGLFYYLYRYSPYLNYINRQIVKLKQKCNWFIS